MFATEIQLTLLNRTARAELLLESYVDCIQRLRKVAKPIASLIQSVHCEIRSNVVDEYLVHVIRYNTNELSHHSFESGALDFEYTA